MDKKIYLNTERELNLEDDAFTRYNTNAVDIYEKIDGTGKQFYETKQYDIDMWVDIKRNHLGGEKEILRTIKTWKHELELNVDYFQIFILAIRNNSTQKKRRDAFLLEFKEKFPNQKITHAKFNEMEKFYRNNSEKFDKLSLKDLKNQYLNRLINIQKEFYESSYNYFVGLTETHKQEKPKKSLFSKKFNGKRITSNPKVISCYICGKDDIKFGSTICSGCQAKIIYKRHSSKNQNSNITFWFIFILTFLILGFVIGGIGKIFLGGLDEEVLYWIGALSVAIASFVSYKLHQEEEDLISTSYVFKKPNDSSFIVGATFGEDD